MLTILMTVGEFLTISEFRKKVFLCVSGYPQPFSEALQYVIASRTAFVLVKFPPSNYLISDVK